MTPEAILDLLLNMVPVKTADLPRDKIGIYGLVDHEGALRYIGSTSADNESFHKRIHQRHRTGSETHSHYFSKKYNCGRMWRNRLMQQNHSDAKISKDLRSAFIAHHCSAVFVPLNGNKQEIENLEALTIRIAPSSAVLWNGSTETAYPEPSELVNDMMQRLGFDSVEREAVERQNLLYQAEGRSLIPGRGKG